MTSVTATEHRVGTGWRAALVGAVASLAIAFGICAGLVAWAHQTFPDSDDHARQRFREVFPIVEGAGASVLGFQRVPVTLDRRELPGSRRSTEHLTYRVVGSPLGGLLLIGTSLAIGGAITRRRDARQESAVRSGARMAVFFAAACFALSFLLPAGKMFIEQGPSVANAFTIAYRPSHLGAVLWPLVWGLLFGSLGAFIGDHGRRWRQELTTRIEARSRTMANAVRAAAVGLATGTALVLVAGILTAVVGVATHRAEAGRVLGSVTSMAGIAEGIVVGLPHATGASLVASMGVPARFEAKDHVGTGGEHATASIFGGERHHNDRRALGTDGAPRAYPLTVPRYALGGLVIAIVFTVVTGYRAAAGAETVRETLRSVAFAAAILTFALWIIGYLASAEAAFGLRSEAHLSDVRLTIRPSVLEGLLLPPIWAFVGGGIGASLQRLRRRA